MTAHRILRLHESETATIIRELPHGECLSLHFGPSGAWIDPDDGGNHAAALRILARLRGVEVEEE